MSEEKKPREFWLFESNQNHRDMAYVREAIGDYSDIPPMPSSPWLRKMPPPKLIEHCTYLAVKQELEATRKLCDQLAPKEVTSRILQLTQELEAARASLKDWKQEAEMRMDIIVRERRRLADAKDDFNEMSKNANIRIRDLENLLLDAKAQIADYESALKRVMETCPADYDLTDAFHAAWKNAVAVVEKWSGT